ncbi:MAG TPA: hypothetical protein VJH22_06360 [Candidatus Nanoarchaeia archaeon]|nr:hypothetical protein [Candidatus Nanoarchaeia archaeon]
MAQDFVYPQNNEAQFVAMARRLGIGELVFVYREAPPPLQVFEGVKVSHAVVIKDKPLPRMINLIDDAQKTRFASEHPMVWGLCGIERGQKDFLHHRGSGINQVIAKMLAKNQKHYLLDFSLLLHAPQPERSRLMGRMAQNLCLCKKFGVAVHIASFARSPQGMRSTKDLQALLRLIQRL